jgi:hypothetical protein
MIFRGVEAFGNTQPRFTQNLPIETEKSPDSSVPQLVEVMKKVDIKSPEAKMNETSMSDGKGGRIKFNDQLVRHKNVDSKLKPAKKKSSS